MNFNIVTKKLNSFIITTVVFIAFVSFANIVWAENVFIDPTAGSGGNGSFAAPFNSWSDVKFSSTNDYFQKCGTKATLNSSIVVDASGTQYNKIFIGPYFNDGGAPSLRLSAAGAKPILDRGTLAEGSVFTLNGDHITLVNFELRSGESTVRVRGANNTIKYCVIGENSKFGIRVAGTSAVNTIIRNNIIDAKEGLYDQNSFDGIALAPGSSYTKVFLNVFDAWDHNAIELENSDYNEIYNNTAVNPDAINVRFFAFDLGSDYNKIHHNWIADMDARSQFGAGVHNEVYKNVFYSMTNLEDNEGSCIWFQGIAGGESKYNKLYNNIIYNIEREAVAFYNNPNNGDVQYNEVYKNVILNSGTAGLPSIWIDKNTNGVLNQSIADNFFFNENGDDLIRHRGEIISTSEFNQNNGYDTIINNKWQNPKFKDPKNGDFSFQDDSPLKNAGIEEVEIQIQSKSDLLQAGVSQLMPPILKIVSQQ